MNRRNFLTSIAAVIAAAVVPLPVFEEHVEPCNLELTTRAYYSIDCDWQPSHTYNIGDLVVWNDNGGIKVCKITHTSQVCHPLNLAPPFWRDL
jgi:hypothetical protein